MHISDWSSDVCSSDREPVPTMSIGACTLAITLHLAALKPEEATILTLKKPARSSVVRMWNSAAAETPVPPSQRSTASVRYWRDRKRGVSGKSVSVRVDLGGLSNSKNKIINNKH